VAAQQKISLSFSEQGACIHCLFKLCITCTSLTTKVMVLMPTCYFSSLEFIKLKVLFSVYVLHHLISEDVEFQKDIKNELH